MAVCKDEAELTCEMDFESLCPAGWNLCTPGQFNNRNEGWNFNWQDANAGAPQGVSYCKPGDGDLAYHYGLHNTALDTDELLNCDFADSYRPGCDGFEGGSYDYDCDDKEYSALCCAPTSTCGDGEVQEEEDCDDGNNSNLDDCLNTCTWKKPNENGFSSCGNV